jgi:hypothetical protein
LLHLVEVNGGYGVSLEPEIEEVAIDDLSFHVLELMWTETEDIDAMSDFLDQRLWHPNLVPLDYGNTLKDSGVFLAKFSTPQERIDVATRNALFWSTRADAPTDKNRADMFGSNVRLRVVMDAKFNQLRAEFGLAGARGTPEWRPAIRKLLNQEMDRIFMDAVGEVMRGKRLPMNSLPQFEAREPQWLKTHGSFMLMLL